MNITSRHEYNRARRSIETAVANLVNVLHAYHGASIDWRADHSLALISDSQFDAFTYAERELHAAGLFQWATTDDPNYASF